MEDGSTKAYIYNIERWILCFVYIFIYMINIMFFLKKKRKEKKIVFRMDDVYGMQYIFHSPKENDVYFL